MSSNSSVGCFRFESAILVNKNGCHETEGSKTLGDNIGLNITIIVFASPNNTTFSFDSLCDHIVNKPVFVSETSFLIFFDEFFLVNLFEDIFK